MVELIPWIYFLPVSMDSITLEGALKIVAAVERRRQHVREYKKAKRLDPEWVERERAQRRAYMARKREEMKQLLALENERRVAEGLEPIEPKKPGRPRKPLPPKLSP